MYEKHKDKPSHGMVPMECYQGYNLKGISNTMCIGSLGSSLALEGLSLCLHEILNVGDPQIVWVSIGPMCLTCGA